ncbi:MAG: peptidase [Isosphaeraceae bacterium]|jgi:hypothetical protein|nr:MAG: peptidase [Isosphaeraceae bacterium]
MLGLAAVLFFSVTGLTLNHPDWFAGLERVRHAEGTLDPAWLTDQVDQLRIVEHLRRVHDVRGSLAEFRTDDPYECLIAFRGPGRDADAFVDRQTGRYQLTQTDHGLIAILNDLHKGRDTGPVWSLVIDLSAIVLTLISLTGLTLLFYLKLRRVSGTIVVVAGTLLILAAWLLGVP